MLLLVTVAGAATGAAAGSVKGRAGAAARLRSGRGAGAGKVPVAGAGNAPMTGDGKVAPPGREMGGRGAPVVAGRPGKFGRGGRPKPGGMEMSNLSLYLPRCLILLA